MSAATPGSAQLNRLLGQTMGSAVRTPLHSLLGFLELLAASDVDADQRRLVDQLVSSAEELLSASSRVTWLLRLAAGDATRHDQRVDLADVVAELAEVPGARVRAVVAGTAPGSLVTDASALHQLLGELLANAAVHGEEPVTLDVTPVEGAVRFTVADAGPGLPAWAATLLRAGDAPAGPTTVGLLLARQLGELLGASFDVDRARVSVCVPVGAATSAGGRSRDRSGAVEGTATRALQVLYVEDNATNRLLTQRQLSRLGHELVAVATGEAGVEEALKGSFDVVLMDRHLPDIDGCEATRRIRAATADGPRLPVLGVTADVTDESIEACLAAGMDEVLTKPVDLKSLAAALARATAGSTASDAAVRPAPAPPVLHRIAERLDGEADAVADVVSTYLAELPGRRLKIQASVRRQEPRALLAAAESLRTSSEWLGASAVAGSCAALSAAAQAGALDTARAFLPRLLLHCQQVQEELAPYTDGQLVRTALAAR
ncbi:response regulator [Motilibacter aurantiacus]|uniref:response regulator n=1 Tax=Motilibacter aurantiacus TaxID=2714955 RepID=UPI001408EA35|nr:response regulator [Motilibacter aurantiacus]NHC44422.1 response regulator [Motilibacter aurantiacus]